jgi:hypothetical protein
MTLRRIPRLTAVVQQRTLRKEQETLSAIALCHAKAQRRKGFFSWRLGVKFLIAEKD